MGAREAGQEERVVDGLDGGQVPGAVVVDGAVPVRDQAGQVQPAQKLPPGGHVGIEPRMQVGQEIQEGFLALLQVENVLAQLVDLVVHVQVHGPGAVQAQDPLAPDLRNVLQGIQGVAERLDDRAVHLAARQEGGHGPETDLPGLTHERIKVLERLEFRVL